VKTRLYFDEDAMNKVLVRALRTRGVDVQTAGEAGMIKREDIEQLEYAASQHRVLFSFNRGHFCRLHAQFMAAGKVHAGIITCEQQRYDIGRQMRLLLQIIAHKTPEEMRNQLEFLSDWG
jgi:uncharacterized protein with PIN domain